MSDLSGSPRCGRYVAIYLTPTEYDAASEADLRYELARQAVSPDGTTRRKNTA